ncbi:MAG: MATE family efflux transporter, partial [Oscillospiraceae bacterium]|nr:MATE family efflux transporter [Oscillospiraceae bacterium]
GGGVLCSRFFGAGETERLRRTVSTALMVGLLGGILFGGVGIALAEPLLRLIGSPADVAPLAAVYLRIYFAGMPVIALYNFSSAGLRALGDTERPLLFLSLAGVINVALNLFFVLGLHIDVAGVALATVISQCVSCVLTVRCLLRTEELSLRELRFSGPLFRQIVRIGLPAGIQGSLFSISNFLIQSSVNSFGAAVIAGNSACQSLEGFAYTGQDATAQAATTAISQNVGAQEYDRSRKAVRYCLLIVTVLSVVVSGLFLLFRAPLVRLYTTNPDALKAAYIRMGIVTGSYIINGGMAVMTGVNRGLGYGTLPAAVTFLGACVFRIVWIYTAFAAHRTLPWLYVSYPISWAITTAAHLICYFIVRKRAFRHALAENR